MTEYQKLIAQMATTLVAADWGASQAVDRAKELAKLVGIEEPKKRRK